MKQLLQKFGFRDHSDHRDLILAPPQKRLATPRVTVHPRGSGQAGLLFANASGGPLGASGVRRHHLAPLLESLGIAPGGFHSFRHGLATRLFQQGAGAAAVQRLMRHSSIHTTMRYAAVSFDDLVRSSNAGAQPLAASLASAPRCAQPVSNVPDASDLPIGSEGT
jgi:integrase